MLAAQNSGMTPDTSRAHVGIVPPLLMLPGLMCDHGFWQPFMDHSKDLICQVVDYGDSTTIAAMAEAALAVAPAYFSLAGHSMGGRVALAVTRLAPERVHKLVLMGSGYLSLPDGKAGEAERAGRLALVEIARQDGVQAMCDQWVKAMVHPERLDDAPLIGAIRAMFMRKSAERLARQQQALLTRPDSTPALRALKLPTLVLCGRQDGWANVAQHEAMQALAPHAGLAVIEGAGHMMLMERPQATSQAIRNFLDEMPSAHLKFMQAFLC